LPPAPIPEPVAPPGIQYSAPQPGQGRLIVDVTDGPAPVERIRMIAKPITSPFTMTHYNLEEGSEVLCAHSPCVTDLPSGNIILSFPLIGRDESEVELVHVGPDASVYRRTLSVYTDNTGSERTLGIIGTAVGGTALMTGAVLLPIGIAEGMNTMTWAGGISLGVGTAVMTIGILMMRHDAPTYRPGSSNHFPLAAPPR
jgi:hypothetical protein